MQFAQIKETCLYTTHLERAEQFYSTIMGLKKFGSSEGRHVFFKAGNSMLLIFNPETTGSDTKLPPHDGKGRLHLAFEVREGDYDICKRKLAERGVSIIQEEIWAKGHKSFYFRDPDGHLLEVVEEGMWEN